MKVTHFLIRHYLFILIVLLASLLRLSALSQVPASLNIDEQALGYNAYSLLKTGLDEHGKFFPISLESYGDWKLIGYPLTTMPFIQVLGLNDVSVRLPSALAGIIQVVLLYFLSFYLFKKKSLALLTSFLLAVSPWGIYFSRIAYEVNVATMYFIAGLLSFIVYQQHTKKHIFFFLSCLFFALTMVTYHAFIIFTPLFCVVTFFLYRKSLQKNLFTFLGFFCLLVFGFFVCKSVVSNSSGKLSDLAIWHNANVVYNRADIFRTDGSSDAFLGKIFYTKYFAIFSQFEQNYIATFSPTFLFDTGGQKLVNSLGYFGNFYVLDSILFILGFMSITSFKVKSKELLLVWLLLGIVPSAITNDAPSSTRLFLLLPLFVILGGCGFSFLLDICRRNIYTKVFFIGFCFAYCIHILFFFDAYFYHINYQRGIFLHYGYEQAVSIAKQYPNDRVVMRGPDNFPYMAFLFYTQYDPQKFRKEVVYYPQHHGVFDEVKSFGRYQFVDTIDYTKLTPNTLYIDNAGNSSDKVIRLPNGKPIFTYFFKKQ